MVEHQREAKGDLITVNLLFASKDKIASIILIVPADERLFLLNHKIKDLKSHRINLKLMGGFENALLLPFSFFSHITTETWAILKK